ncbi:MAG: tetratricopeptide repeat protein [Bacteroidales bacterium]|nr:tetratricopeptide repeat protein [Bacteroidales bacterium]
MRRSYMLNRFLTIIILAFSLAGCNFAGKEVVTDTTTADTIMDELARLKRLTELEPNNAAFHNQLASVYLKRDNLNEALHFINKSLELEPSNEYNYFILSDIYLMMGDANRALTTLLKASDLSPNNADVYAQLGRLQIIMEDYPRAIKNLHEALALNSNHSKALYWRGFYHLERNDTARAISDFQLSVAVDQEFFEGYMELGQLLLAKGDKLAYDYFEHALQSAPPEPELLYSVAFLLQENERSFQAIEAYQRILKIDSTFYKAWYNLGYLYLTERDEADKALGYFNKALDINPEYVDAVYNRGLIYELREDYASARRDYLKALKMQLNHEKAIEGLNRLDKLQGK